MENEDKSVKIKCPGVNAKRKAVFKEPTIDVVLEIFQETETTVDSIVNCEYASQDKQIKFCNASDEKVRCIYSMDQPEYNKIKFSIGLPLYKNQVNDV